MPLNPTHVEDCFSATCSDREKKLSSFILQLSMSSESTDKVVITNINKLLSASKTRLAGLEFLNLIISNCSFDILTANAINWINHCVVVHANDLLKEIKFKTIGILVEALHNNQDFSKKFLADYQARILESCLNAQFNNFETASALECLAICVRSYSGWFNTHKAKLETFLIKFLDNRNERLVEKAAIVFVALQQVGGAGADGINHKRNFSEQFHKLCNTVQKLYDQLFEDVSEMDIVTRSSEQEFSFLEGNDGTSIFVLDRRIRNCLIFLKKMIQLKFSAAKEIQPKQLLDVIRRGAAVHICLGGDDQSKENYSFSIILNNIQVQLLQLLRLFLIWYQTNSLPFSFIISKLLIDLLNRCHNCECYKTVSYYQEIVYKNIDYWIRIAKSSFQSHFQTQLIDCILKDVSVIKTNVTLTMISTDSKKKKSKQRAVQNKMLEKSEVNPNYIKPIIQTNQETNCKFALDVLKQILAYGDLKIKPKTLEKIYQTITVNLTDIQANRISHPYFNIKCQSALYEVLVALFEQSHVPILPSLQLTMNIFNRGLSHSHRNIVQSCELGLSVMEKICQPVCSTLYLPHEGGNVVEMNQIDFNFGANDEMTLLQKPSLTSINSGINIIDMTIIPPAEKVDENIVIESSNGSDAVEVVETAEVEDIEEDVEETAEVLEEITEVLEETTNIVNEIIKPVEVSKENGSMKREISLEPGHEESEPQEKRIRSETDLESILSDDGFINEVKDV